MRGAAGRGAGGSATGGGDLANQVAVRQSRQTGLVVGPTVGSLERQLGRHSAFRRFPPGRNPAIHRLKFDSRLLVAPSHCAGGIRFVYAAGVLTVLREQEHTEDGLSLLFELVAADS